MWRWLSAWVGLLLIGVSISAQRPAVRNLSSEDGLAHPQVWAIHQDSRGYIWFGTSGGLTRYDGSQMVSWGVRHGLTNQTIRSIAEGTDGALWLGTEDGVARFDGREIRSFSGEPDAPGGTTWVVRQGPWGNMWFANQYGGVYRYADGSFGSWNATDGLASNYVYGMTFDSRGRLWLGHRGAGITRCEVGPDGPTLCTTIETATAEEPSRGEVRAFLETAGESMWVATRGGGLLRIEPDDSISRFDIDDGIRENDVYALELTAEEELVAGTIHEGLSICELPDLGSCRTMDQSTGMAAQNVLSLFVDDEENLWVGTEAGVSRIGSQARVSLSEVDGLPNSTVYSLHLEPDGFWIGTLGGFSRVDTTEAEWDVKTWRGGIDVVPNEAWDIAAVAGRTWMATDRGICELDRNGGCFRRITSADGLLADQVMSLAPGRHENELIAAVLDGISILDITNERPTPYITNIPLDTFEVEAVPYGLAVDSHDRVWIGTDQGLVLMEGSSFTASWGEEEGLPVQENNALIVGRDDKLWIGLNGGGLVSAELPRKGSYALTFEQFDQQQGVPDEVAAIAEGEGSELWIGSNNGIFRFDRETGRARPELDRTGGLSGNEVNVIRTRGPDVWIGTTGGMTLYRSDVEPTSAAPPPVVIHRVSRFGGPDWAAPFSRSSSGEWLPDMRASLAHDQNNLRFEYGAVAFSDQGLLRYQIRLVGFQDDWSETTETYKEYTNLDPAAYEFQVRASRRGERWSKPASVPFEIDPAWYETPWFLILLALLLIFAIVLGFRMRTHRMHRRTLELESAVADRTEDLRRYARALEEHSHALDRANVRIREADRIKGEFLTNMSHELRTPLNSIIGFSDVLSTRLAERMDDTEQRFLRNIGNSGRYLLLLINNLLDLSKIEAGQMDVEVETVSPGSILRRTSEVVQGYAKDKEIEIRTEVDPDMPMVSVDVAKLNQILLNLLSNAIKFSERGSEVVVRVEPLGDRMWKLEVEDQGSGIPEHEQGRIFDEFRQAGIPGHPGGTGLGLSLVRRYTRLMGGEVTFHSAEGKGSCFGVDLPMEVTASKVDSGDGWLLEDVASKVLIVEESPGSLARLSALLESENLVPVRIGADEDIERMVSEVEPSVMVLDGESGRRPVSGLEGSPENEIAYILCRRSGSQLQLAAGFDQMLEDPPPEMLETVLESLRPLDRLGRKLRVLIPAWLDLGLDQYDLELIRFDQSDDLVGMAEQSDVVIVALGEETTGLGAAHRIQSDRKTRHMPVIGVRISNLEATPPPAPYRGRSTIEDLSLLIHELLRRRSSRIVRRAASSL